MGVGDRPSLQEGEDEVEDHVAGRLHRLGGVPRAGPGHALPPPGDPVRGEREEERLAHPFFPKTRHERRDERHLHEVKRDPFDADHGRSRILGRGDRSKTRKPRSPSRNREVTRYPSSMYAARARRASRRHSRARSRLALRIA